jgi:glycosyltransferase involved in cell wall biosynthesis
MESAMLTPSERLKALKCAVIIPTYNNVGTIATVIADVKKYASDIIVVNDGCTDNTAEVLASIDGIKVIDYGKNKGKGYALRLALKRAYEWGYEYAITIDADGQHYADDIPVFIDRIEEEPNSLLVGARNLAADNMPSKNTFANKFSNFWYRVETGKRLTDTQSGYRLYPLKPLHNIRLITRRYEFEVEIIVRAAWRGINVENVPIKVYYPPVEERVSHFRPFKDFTRISILNTVLVIYALLFYYPWRFFRQFSPENVRKFMAKHVIHSKESNVRMSCAIALGVFCSVISVWGYQAILAAVIAQLLRLNKIVAAAFTGISIPPLIPVIIYVSMVLGAEALGIKNYVTLENISHQSALQSINQYIIGSVILGAILAVVGFIIAYFIMRKYRHSHE